MVRVLCCGCPGGYLSDISRGLAAVNYDQSRAPEIANAHGVTSEDWATAVDGWNARIQANRAVGQHFNALYTQR